LPLFSVPSLRSLCLCGAISSFSGGINGRGTFREPLPRGPWYVFGGWPARALQDWPAGGAQLGSFRADAASGRREPRNLASKASRSANARPGWPGARFLRSASRRDASVGMTRLRKRHPERSFSPSVLAKHVRPLGTRKVGSVGRAGLGPRRRLSCLWWGFVARSSLRSLRGVLSFEDENDDEDEDEGGAAGSSIQHPASATRPAPITRHESRVTSPDGAPTTGRS
jgi:hypothetical protein